MFFDSRVRITQKSSDIKIRSFGLRQLSCIAIRLNLNETDIVSIGVGTYLKNPAFTKRKSLSEQYAS